MSKDLPENEQFKKQRELDKYRRQLRKFLGLILPLITDLDILRALLETANFEFARRWAEIIQEKQAEKNKQDQDTLD